MSTLTNNLGQPSATVLVVDDEPNSLGMVYQTLESAGYTVLVADDGTTALRILERVTPDAILMDAVMPGLSGFEACRLIKASPSQRHIPIIFMTGLSETSDVLEGFAAGGIDYVVKPVKDVEVLARLRSHIAVTQSLRVAEQAIDADGAGLLVLDVTYRILWSSQCAERLLREAHIEPLQKTIPSSWIPSTGGEVNRIPDADGALSLRYLALSSRGEIMLLVSPYAASEHINGLAQLALTPREMDVLMWLAKGKTNREIGDMLYLSPRTVSKHLEHVFQKLGVQTRSAAAAMAASLVR